MGARPQAVSLVRRRIALTAIFCAFAFAIIGVRLVDVMVLGTRATAMAAQIAPSVHQKRADFVDRNGVLIARDLPVADLYATPAAFWDADEAAHALSVAIGASEAHLRNAFAPGRGYVPVRRALTPDDRDAVMRLGLPGLIFEERFKRYYPSGRIVAHAVGLVDVDGNGVSGLELGLDDRVRRSDRIALSFDMRVQYALGHEIARTAEEFRAIAAGGIVLNVHTGEVLALVSLPDYEPNVRNVQEGDSTRNRMTQDVYELGSIFKLFAFAQALEENALRLDETIDVRSPLELGRYRIHDFDEHGTELPAALVFAESSNIGTARIALRSGPENQRAFLERMGLLTLLTTEIPEIAAPLLPRRWGEVETATVSYGHGISVNPLSFAAATAALVNGGTKIRPTFLKSDTAQRGERVVSLRTSRTMRHLLRLAVTNGTGGNADVPGYDVGGKTGTAEKPAGRGYSRSRRISSFVGVFPASDPEFLVFIMFDEPKGTRASYGFATGGWTAAPATGRVIARIAPLLGVLRNDTLAAVVP